MTAPLPAVGPLVAPPAPHHAAKVAREAPFALPEPQAGKPVEKLPRSAEADDLPDGDMVLAVAPPELPPTLAPLNPALAPAGGEAPAAPLAGGEAPALPPADDPAANVPPAGASPPVAPSVAARKPGVPTAVAAAAPTDAAPDPTVLAQSSLAPAAHPVASAQASPTAAMPVASSAAPIIAAADAGSGQSTGQDRRAPARQPATVPAASVAASADAAVQLPPFRMDAAGVAPQAALPSAVMRGEASPAPGPAAYTPDLAAAEPGHMPDVVVGLVGAASLDVTISAPTADSLQRLSAAEPELRQALTELGAEVEAIRMELRPEPGSDRGADRGAAGPEAGAEGRAASAGQGGRRDGQGEARMPDTSKRNDLNQSRAEGVAQPVRAIRLTATGRIDRYA